MFLSYQKSVTITTTSVISGLLVYICCKGLKSLIKMYISDKKDSISQSPASKKAPVHDVLFFPDQGFVCKPFFSSVGCLIKKCNFVHAETSLSKMCSYLNKAEKSVDACLFILTNKDLCVCLLDACRRGVKVRLIIDATMAQAEGKRLKRLSDHGIFICEAVSNFLVHHKFAVVDDELLMTGSFNWTMQATLGNWDNVLITSEERLVQPFSSEFNKLWEKFSQYKPIQPPPKFAYPFMKNSAWEGIIIGHEDPFAQIKI